MMRIRSLLIALLTLSASNVQAEAQCMVWGKFSNVSDAQTTTMGKTNKNHLTINADLIYRTLQISENYQWVGIQLHQAEVIADGLSFVSPLYSVPMAAKIENKTGTVLGYHFAASLKNNDKKKLIAVFDTLHLKQWPSAITDKYYITREKDDIGEYRIEYRQLEKDKIERNKLEYIKPDIKNTASKMFKLDKISINHDEFIFDKGDCWHKKVKGKSDIRVASSDNSIVVRSQSNITMKHQDKPLPKNALLLSLSENPKDWGMIPESVIYPRAARKPLKNKKAFIHAFSGMDLLSMDKEQALEFLYDNEIYLSELKSILQAEALSDKEQMRLFMLLGKNDSPQSHELLVDIFSDENLDAKHRFRSLMALKNSENPIDKDVVDKLFSYANDRSLQGENLRLSHTATLIMGGVARNQRDSEFGRYISERLANQIQSAQSDTEVGLLLTALGNSSNESNQDTIASYLDNDNSVVRAKAAAALGKIPNEQTLSYLASQLPTENDSNAQSAILKSMGANELNQQQVNTVYDYAANSSDEKVRAAAISALSKQPKSDSVIANLQSLKKSEKNYNNLRNIMKTLYKK